MLGGDGGVCEAPPAANDKREIIKLKKGVELVLDAGVNREEIRSVCRVPTPSGQS